MRFVALFLAVCAIVATPFAIWGTSFTTHLSGDEGLTFLRSVGGWAWALAISLLVADLLLPIPATAVMGMLGMIYGPLLGGVLGALGSILSGLLAYWLCRAFGGRIAVKISGEEDIEKAARFFAQSGGWAIALSRWVPILPEAMACLAGLARMDARNFSLALICGSAPMAFAFAFVGSTGSSNPGGTLLVCAMAPVALYLLARPLLSKLPSRR
ncbi:MAG: VTT domain-containing protein [Candidatus Brocadiia bacterium]